MSITFGRKAALADGPAAGAGGPAASSVGGLAVGVQQQEEVPLREAIVRLPAAPEHREGYDRELFEHWIDGDGCDTRREVLVAEAVRPPQVGRRCRLTDGAWYGYYDNAEGTDTGRLDIDHMVSLVEAWDSGAYAWDDVRRRDYANDLDDPRALVTVTDRYNQQKADKAPVQWQPRTNPPGAAYGEWVAIKLRWRPSADAAEKNALTDCPNDPVP